MIKECKVARLKFQSGLHLGEKISDESDTSSKRLHSDTLSAALVSTYVTQGGVEAEKFMQSFRISSAMPYVGDSYLLPLPIAKQTLRFEEEADNPSNKQIKRAEWIESALWSKMSRNGVLTISKEALSGCKSALLNDRNDVCIMKSKLEQKVSVSKEGGDAVPYFFSRVFFGRDCGLYIIYQTTDEALFRRTLAQLGAEGIGAKRSVGNGLFEVDFSTLRIDVPDNANYCQLLSLCVPSDADLQSCRLQRSCYSLTTRSGYMSGAMNLPDRNKVRKSVNMISEGAVMSCSSIEGSVVDVRPDMFTTHPVWRDGRALCLPFNFVNPYEI